MRHPAILLLWSALFVLLTGASECAHNRFVIDMRPAGDGLERKLEVTRAGGEDKVVPAEVLARVAKAYPADGAKTENDVHRFKGTFSGKLPGDVGGAGYQRVFQGKLGQAWHYQERFAGRDDPGAQIAAGLAAVDRLVELLGGWARWACDEQAGFAKLEAFLTKRLRADLKDLLVLLTTSLVLTDYAPGVEQEMGARGAQLLIERGYLDPADLAALLVAFERDDALPSAERTHTMAFVRRKLATELGQAAGQDVPACLDFTKTPDSAHASLLAYLKTTEEYRQRARGDKEMTPQKALDDMLETLLPFELFVTMDELALSLACPVEPYSTNGTWEAGAKKVTWKQAALRDAPRLPTFAFAAWATPDEAFQEAHLGKSALSGQKLAEVLVWRNGLGKDEAAQWDAFLEGLAPGKELAAKLKGFRFKAEPADRDSLAAYATGRILEALNLAPEPDKG